MIKTFNWSDKLIAGLTLLSGLSISAVAVYYSVAGLVAIFAAAVVPIVVMGVALEVSKLVATIWLKQNWRRAPLFIKSYLMIAVTILMMITSMGIFGFLSKAHIDQGVPTGDVAAKVFMIDEKIKIERDNIENARAVIKQLDDAVNGINANGSNREIKLKDGRSYTRSAAELALQVRRSQAKDRAALTKQIEESQSRIVKLQEEKAPIAANLRKVEAEVGPIKYIAALIYGDNPDTNLLEKAVRWVIIIIVAVFDPLAVILLLASQYSFGWFRNEREQEEETPAPRQSPPTVTGPGATLVEPSTPRYPNNEEDIEELILALEEAALKDESNVSTDTGVNVQDLARHDDSNDEPVRVDAPAANEEVKPKRVRKVKAVAPPGTPGEEWAVTSETAESEQQPDDNLDKIYKASSEELAKRNRSRGWFNAAFPKKDDI
jgi:hypothetical protein